jgi:hypothetical protein
MIPGKARSQRWSSHFHLLGERGIVDRLNDGKFLGEEIPIKFLA